MRGRKRSDLRRDGAADMNNAADVAVGVRASLAAGVAKAQGEFMAMVELDADPDGDRLTEAALNGTLPTTTVTAAAAERRRAAGRPIE